MRINNFLKLGVASVLTMVAVSNVLAQEDNKIGVDTNLDNTEIVQIVKQNISKEDLAYVILNQNRDNADKTEVIYKNIKDTVNLKYGDKKIKEVEKDLNKLFSGLSMYKNIPVSYTYAIPKPILDEMYAEGNLKTDTSIAYGTMDISQKCFVSVKLALDDKGRLFESSELVAHNIKDISSLSDKEIKSVLHETILHETSHCVLHEEMKNPEWKLEFSKEFSEKYPQTAKNLNDKIKFVRDKIAQNKKGDFNNLDYLTFVNFNESFADVMSGFAKLGEHPTKESIAEAKRQLINVSAYREKSDLLHSTQYAVQYALDKMDYAATLTIEQRKNWPYKLQVILY